MRHIQFDDKMINKLAKAMTGYCFRNGPVENFHAAKCLTSEQMKELDIFMVDRLGFCLRLLSEQNFDDLDVLLGFHYVLCRNWNDVDFSVGDNELAELKRIADMANKRKLELT